MTSQSALMVGRVAHARYQPVIHKFCYDMFMVRIDLDELVELQQKVWGFGEKWWHWARFRREDYVGEGKMKSAVQAKVEEITGVHITGKVIMVCHLRYLGLYFSPVNFYYLYDDDGNWKYLLAEVSNTPWNQRHYYALSADKGNQGQNWEHQKAFHVSPFNPIEQHYKWRLKPLTNNLMVHLECHRENKEFDATLSLKAREFTTSNFLKLLAFTPIQTAKVVVGIYWQAAKLFIKKAPFYPHPGSGEQKNVSETNLKGDHHA